MKITPAHDPNDFMVGKRHGLAFINVLEDSGAINAEGSQFKGQHRFQASIEAMLAASLPACLAMDSCSAPCRRRCHHA